MYYKSSGKVSPLSILISTLVIAIVTVIIAFAYTYAVWYIPFIYINFFICLGAGFALLFVVTTVLKKLKSRNRIFDFCLALFGGLLLSYTNWVIWSDLVMNSGESYNLGTKLGITVSSSSLTRVLYLFFNPLEVLNFATMINEYGTWGFKSIPVSGIFLLVFWIIEAGILIGFAPFITALNDAEPFCEQTNEWAEKKELPAKYSKIIDIESIKRKLETRNYDDILNLEKATDDSMEFSKIYLYPVESNRVHYMTVKNFEGKLDKNKEVSYTESTVVNAIEINQSLATSLLNAH